MAHKLEVLHLLQQLKTAGRTIVMVLHDVNHTARYFHHNVAILEGRVVTTELPDEAGTPQMLRSAFVKLHLRLNSAQGSPLCVFYDFCG